MSPEILPSTTGRADRGQARRRDRARPARVPPAGASASSTPSGSLLLVAVLGLWEGLSRAEVIDPFNFSMPSEDLGPDLAPGSPHGTAPGSLGEQIWYTL